MSDAPCKHWAKIEAGQTITLPVSADTRCPICRAEEAEAKLAAALKAKEELRDERLRARTAALEAGYNGGDLAEIIRDLKRAKEEAERELNLEPISEWRRDAQRYRWLRVYPNNMLPEEQSLDGQRLDYAIDVILAQEAMRK